MENRENHRHRLGRLGEEIACRHLESIGHTILERNWRSGHLEIDIISTDREGIHFVEVKSRQQSIQAPPQENVGTTKQARIVKAALGYLNSPDRAQVGEMECFFDVIAVTLDDEGTHIEWIPQAYIPLYR